MNTKIKVRVADLIAAIEAKREADRTAHETQAAGYEARVAAWRIEVLSVLDAFRDNFATSGELPRDRYNSGSVGPILPNRPYEPRPFDATGYDRDIATLRICAEDAIAITAQDYGRYLA